LGLPRRAAFGDPRLQLQQPRLGDVGERKIGIDGERCFAPTIGPAIGDSSGSIAST
jgi:hypothetical protein